MVGKKGDIIRQVYLACGHIDLDIQENAAKKPMWAIYDIKVGTTVKCPFCHQTTTVENVKTIRGWGDP